MKFKIIDLNVYKINKCNILRNHDKFKCIFYHNKFDIRRDLRIIFYENMLCNNKNCEDKNCELSHNKFELLYHPKNYKKTYCREYLNNKKCKYEIFCSFAHDNEELRINLLHEMKFNLDFFLFHFKTEFCPIPAKFNHNRFKCVYAHNYQDFRRKPKKSLLNKYCEHWRSKKFIKIYKNGCPDGYNCNKCHGWKEKEYHVTDYLFKKIKTLSTWDSLKSNTEFKKIYLQIVPKKRREVIF